MIAMCFVFIADMASDSVDIPWWLYIVGFALALTLE